MIKKRLTLIVLLSFAIYACSGQNNPKDLPKTTTQVDSTNTLSNKPNKQDGLPFPFIQSQINQVVRTIFQDSKRNIWFGTELGAYKYDGKSLTYINDIKSPSETRVTIKDIKEGRDGKIWFAHTDGISSLEGDSITNYYQSDGLLSYDVWCITPDGNGTIWIGTINGLCRFDGKKFTKFELPEGKKDSSVGVSSTKMVHNIKEDSKGTIWISSTAGLFSYSNNTLTNVSEKVGIPTNFVNEIFEDKQGEIWISTKKGLYKLSDQTLTNITEGKIENGKGIGSIAEDKDGKIWFVSNQHFLYTYDRETLLEYQKTETNKGPVIFKIYKDLDDRLWFVGYGGAFRLEDGKFLNITKNGPW